MKFLNEKTLDNIKKDIIFVIARTAKEFELQGKKIYNGVLGTLRDEEGKLFIHDSFYKIFNSIDDSIKASYTTSIDGGEQFKNAVKQWVFQKNEFLKISEVIATPGGSGALSASLDKTLYEGETVIIPDIFWGPYEIMINSKKLNAVKYSCFTEEGFTLEPLKEAVREVVKKQDNIVLIINDPAHNPTGFSMGKQLWDALISFVNSIAQNGKTVTIINDIAYIDYSENFEKSREYMQTFKNINDNVLILFAFSGSKTLTAYGMRIGAVIVYANQQEDINSVHSLLTHVARATWSNANNGAINAIVRLMENEALFKKDLLKATSLLAERRNLFITEANRVGLKFYPNDEGFFVTLVGIADNQKLYEHLIRKNVFVVPQMKGIRVAICSLNKQQCQELPEIIQDTIREIENEK